jgi:hypothetical protein
MSVVIPYRIEHFAFWIASLNGQLDGPKPDRDDQAPLAVLFDWSTGQTASSGDDAKG